MNNALRIVTLLVIGSFSVSAQLSQELFAKVPFDFVAGYKNFPAGEYRVFRGSAPGIVSVRSLDGKTGGFILSQRTESANAHAKSSLIFNRYGSRYFLSQIWVEGDRAGVLFRPTSAEVEAARHFGVTTESVITSGHER